MTLSSTSLNFGAVQHSQASSVNFTIGNDGTADLVVSNISSSNGYYTVSPTSFTVAPGATQSVTVTVTPYEYNVQTGTLTISNSSSSANTVAVWALGTSAGGTTVSGVISSTTWTASSGPYIVIDDILLQEGSTLTIEAGTLKRPELETMQYFVKGIVNKFPTQ